MDEFIFIELPKVQVAVFHFYRKVFENHKEAYTKAMEVIKTFY